MEESQEGLWRELNEFYVQNQVVIERAAAMDIVIDKMSEMDMALETFVETANALLPGLVGLANIHPGLGGTPVTFPFKPSKLTGLKLLSLLSLELCNWIWLGE